MYKNTDKKSYYQWVLERAALKVEISKNKNLLGKTDIRQIEYEIDIDKLLEEDSLKKINVKA